MTYMGTIGNAFMATVVAKGRGVGIVVRTGKHTAVRQDAPCVHDLVQLKHMPVDR